MAAHTLISKDNLPATVKEKAYSLISVAKLLFSAVLLLLLAAGVVWQWEVTSRLAPPLLIGIGFIGVYPLTYLAYLAFGEDAQRKRLRDDFQLFGLVDDKDLDDTINQLYQNVYSWPQFAVYIALIMVVTIVVLLGYVNRDNLLILSLPDSLGSPDSMELIFYGYLGAYVFSIQELVRRYNTFDLQPQVYSAILVRMLVALSLTFVIINVIMLDGRFLQSGGAANGANGADAANAKAWLVIIAFAIGIFPGDGINWLTQQAGRILAPSTKNSSELPLRNLLGINAWHESRLTMMGIDDAQNLATADIPKLLLTTQFDTQQVANWIDQAILYVKVQERIERFREAKINTFHELQCAIESLSAGAVFNNGTQPASAISSENEAKSSLATVLGLTSPDELKRLREYSNFPNYTHIANFYEGSGRVGSQRAEESVQKLTGIGSVDIGKRLKSHSDSVQDREREHQKLLSLRRQLHGRAKDPSLHVQMGIINYKQTAFDLAKQRFDSAIALDNKFAQAYLGRGAVCWELGEPELAIQATSRAIELNPGDAEAFNQRGLIYFKMSYPDRAIEDLNRAIELDYSLAVAYYNRGVAFHAQGQLNKAITDFERARLLGYNQAGLWLVWGLALLNKNAYEEVIEKLSTASVRDPHLADAYANRGKAYAALGNICFNRADKDESLTITESNRQIEAGNAYFDRARKDFLTAIQKDGSLWGTQNDLASLELQRGNLQNAVAHYQTAIKTRAAEDNEIYFLAHCNLALTYRQLSDFERAIEQYQKVNQVTAVRYLTPDEQEKLDNLADLLGLSSKTFQKLQRTFDLYHQLKDIDGQALTAKHMGNFFQRKGEWSMAISHFEQAAKLYAKLEKGEDVEVLNNAIALLQGQLANAQHNDNFQPHEDKQ